MIIYEGNFQQFYKRYAEGIFQLIFVFFQRFACKNKISLRFHTLSSNKIKVAMIAHKNTSNKDYGYASDFQAADVRGKLFLFFVCILAKEGKVNVF